jgi:predicted enzyme related to lactoylglutathione lyase
MAIRNAIAVIAVKNLQAATPWYEKLIGRGPDRIDPSGSREWIFEQGGRLQLREDQARAGRALITCAVGDLDKETQQLSIAGITIGEVNRTSSERVFTIEDPDGNTIALAEILAPVPKEALPTVSPTETPQPLERALESIAADTRISSQTVRRFLDNLILDLEALLRASEESSMSGQDPGLAAQLLQRAHIVRGKVSAPPS